MKELDFDELDRAVSSLMTNVPSTDTNASSDDDKPEKTLTLDPSKATPDDSISAPAATSSAPPSSSSSSTAAPSQPTSPVVTPTPPSSNTLMVPPTLVVPSVAVRRGGRFMDVVHPSSDMKKPESPQAPISRQGATIAPLPSASAPAEEPIRPVSIPPAAEPAKSTPPVVEPKAPVSEWPDPLDVANFKDESPAPAPLTTPFLTGAKVEKRPLGGVPDSEPAPEPDKSGIGKEGLTSNDANDQLPVEPADIQAPLPEELQGDLVAIESGAAAQHVALPSKQPDEAPKAPEPAPVKAPMSLPSAPKKPEPAVPVEKPGVTSIPQQYREEPSTGESASGAIYDTANYHQPLAHPGKKKSSWLWVIWIVLILLLGAGAGAALYFFKII